MKKRIFLIKTLILLCGAISVVVAEHQKRDVHKIILQQRVPRNHNRGHAHHNHGKKHQQKYKKGKVESEESYSGSFEDSGSYSSENSFESYHPQKPRKPSKKSPTFHRHLHTNLDVQESRHHPQKKEIQPPFYNEWVPFNYDHLQVHPKESIRREKERNKRKSKRHNYRNAPHIKPYNGIQNSYNINFQSNNPELPLESSSSSTFYPPIDVLSAFSNLNKDILEKNTPITFDEDAPKDTFNRLKNHKAIYDSQNSNNQDLGGYIIVPDNSENVSKELNSPENVHKFNFKNRGSIKFSKQTS